MQRILIALAFVLALQLVSAQEKLSRDEALGYARAIAADLKQLNSTPIPTEVDAEQPVAIRDEDYGGLVLPQKGLKPELITQAGETARPIGQLWLHKLAPMRHGMVVPESDLRLVTVRANGDEATVPQCALAVRRSKAGTLEVLVYGKGKEPIVTTPLQPVKGSQTSPIDLEAERDGDSGKITLKVLGTHQATLWVTELWL